MSLSHSETQALALALAGGAVVINEILIAILNDLIERNVISRDAISTFLESAIQEARHYDGELGREAQRHILNIIEHYAGR